MPKGQASGNRCFWCQGLLCKVVGNDFQKTRDHVIPLSRDGKDVPGNKVVSCLRCNQIKGAMMPDEWDEFRREFPDYRRLDVMRYAEWIRNRLPMPEDVSERTWRASLAFHFAAVRREAERT